MGYRAVVIVSTDRKCPTAERPELSIVLPLYNEELVIDELKRRLFEMLAEITRSRGDRSLISSVEVIFVDDGSKDRTYELVSEIAREDPRCKVSSFARNFGHQKAITAGVDHADGDAVIVMDGDLQDPPSVCIAMIEKWREGFDVVYARRTIRRGESLFKRMTARIFYRLFAAMIPIEVPLDTGDFRLMSRPVVLALRSLAETHRFVRAMVAWVGFRQTAVLYERPERFAGETKYPLSKMVRFAIDGITSFSVLPLRISTYLGLIVSMASCGVGVWALVAKFVFRHVVPGWTALIVLISFVSGAQLLVIGILGEYVGRIYEEVKRRPLYVIKKLQNFSDADE